MVKVLDCKSTVYKEHHRFESYPPYFKKLLSSSGKDFAFSWQQHEFDSHKKYFGSYIAQWLEHIAVNYKVVGSSPTVRVFFLFI